jgi:hypothetical protein
LGKPNAKCVINRAFKENKLTTRFLSPFFKTCCGLATLLVMLTACAGTAPVPGGSDEVNQRCFQSVADMQAHLLRLTPGMPEGEALAALCSKKEDFVRLGRREIRIALLGGDNVLFNDEDAEADSEIIRNLYGYKLAYKSTHRKHGFSSPIRIQTNETGYDYNISLIFKDGLLFEHPILSGGLVNDVSSRTIFDFITPGTVVDHVIP